MEINKYLNWKIYVLQNKINDTIIYVGSWILPLQVRYWIHKRHWIINPNRKIYKFINEIGIENIYIILYKNFPCKNRNELEIEENKIINELLKKNIVLYNKKKIIHNKKKKYTNKIDEKNKCFICNHQFRNSAHKKEHNYWLKHAKNLLKNKND